MAIQRDKITASAEKLVAKGKIEAAIKEYDRLIEENPGDVNTLNRIGDLWGRINRNDEAVKVFTRIADHYSKDGFFLKAIAIYKKINKLDPSKLEIYGKLAELYARQGLAMEAKSQYQVLSDYYMKHGDHANALITYKKISELDPNSLNINVKLADLYSQTGQTVQALEQYEKVGRALLKRGMNDEAAQVFKKAVRLAPENLDLADTAIRVLTEAGDANGASEILKSALEKAPANPRLIARLGRTYLDAGNHAAARETLEQGLNQNPTDLAIRGALAALYLDLGDSEKSWKTLAPVVDDAIARGEPGEAIETMEKIAANDPRNVDVLARLASAYQSSSNTALWASAMTRLSAAHESRGDLEDAVRVADELAQVDPSHRSRAAGLRARMGGGAGGSTEAQPEPTFDMSFDEGPSLDLGLSIEEPEPERLPSAPTAVPSMAADSDEDIDFVTEHMTEAEVFAKYGLTEKAVEHLTLITARYPRNRVARERLVRVWMDEGDAGEIARAVSEYVEILQEEGDVTALTALRDHLKERGLNAAAAAIQVSGAAAVPTSPQAVPEPSPSYDFGPDSGPALSFDEPSLEPEEFEMPEIELDLDAVEPTLDSADVHVEIEAEREEAGLAMDAANETPGFSAELAGFEPAAPPADEPTFDLSFESDAESGISFDSTDAGATPGMPSFEAEIPSGDPGFTMDFGVSGEAGPSPERPPAPEFPDSGYESGAELVDEPEIPFEQEPEVFVEQLPEPLPEPVAPEPVDEVIAFEPAVEPATEPAAEELGEVDFYLDQELLDEAEQRLSGLESQWPESTELLDRRNRIDSARALAASTPSEISALDIESELMAAIPSAPEPARAAPKNPIPVSLDDEAGLFDDEDDFFDLAAELEQELQDDEEIVAVGEEEQSLEDIFREFKKGVEQQLDSEDYETHYNLGIAYKEMGLIDEAIAEFQLASKDPRRMIECCSMLGLCFLEKGMPQLAVKWYLKGLEAPEITEDEQMGLMYDLASAYLEIGDVPSAQRAFVDIYGVNSNYRDVADRIRDLEDANR